MDYNTLLTEYQQLRAEIDGLFKSRVSILAIIVSSVGVILGISDKIESSYQILALYLIVNIGATLTYTYTNIARQKSAYIRVFIEDKTKELNWFTTTEVGEPLPPIVDKVFKKLRIPTGIFPHDFPFIYFILGLIIFAFSFTNIKEFDFNMISLIIVFGNLYLLNVVISIQHALSVTKYKSFIRYYKSLYSKLKLEGY